MDDTSSPASRPGWLERLSHILLREPETLTELSDILHSALARNVLDADAFDMIQGVLSVGEMQVRDVMAPRSKMDVIDIAQSPEEFIPAVIKTAHSRFPVIDGDKDNVIGVLHAKDLLRYYASVGEFNVRDILRPAVFIPETKHLNMLLKEFRDSRNHMALVVDEYGSIAGLVTIEDVIEQIVGEIEDEFDTASDEERIVVDRRGNWRVNGMIEIADLNEALGSTFPDDEFDTLAGLLIDRFRYLPKRGESISFAGFRFLILQADNQHLRLVQIERLTSTHG